MLSLLRDTRFLIALALGMLIHLKIWLGSRFINGDFPQLHTLLLNATGHLNLLGWGVMIASVAGTALAMRAVVARTTPTHTMCGIYHNPRFWQRWIFATFGIYTLLGIGMPLVIVAAGPLTPPIIELGNLLMMYLVLTLVLGTRFSTRQIASQICWLLMIVVSSVAFAFVVTGNGWRALDMLLKGEQANALLLAFGVSFSLHAIFWVAVSFQVGNFPWLQRFVFGQNWQTSTNWPRPQGWLLLTALVGSFVALSWGGMAVYILPETVASHWTNNANLSRFALNTAAGIWVDMLFPVMFVLAAARGPAVVGLTNMSAMVLVLTVADEGVALSWPLVASVAALTYAAIQFASVVERHKATVANRAQHDPIPA